jgi:hypothetical protein
MPLRLFEIRRPEIEGRRVTLRALVKSEAVDPAHQACFALQADAGRAWPGSREHHFGPARKGKTNWTPYEISWDCPAGVQPEALRIDAFLIWEGAIWIKDIEIVTTPAGVSPGPRSPTLTAVESQAKEVVIKKFGPVSDTPISKEIKYRKVSVEGNGWRIESADYTEYSDNTLVPRVHLFEIPYAQSNQEQLIVRFKARSENVQLAYLDVIGNSSSSSRHIEGTTNWKTYEVTMGTFQDRKANTLAIDLILRNNVKAAILIEDLEVVKLPLKSAPAAPTKEIPLKKFDPKTDKPFQVEVDHCHVTVVDNAWRIEAKPDMRVDTQQIRLFEIPKQDLGDCALVLRLKMKTEKVTQSAEAELYVGNTRRDWTGSDTGAIRGTTEWKQYELRRELKESSPQDISIRANFLGTGTMWLKDIELVKIVKP